MTQDLKTSAFKNIEWQSFLEDGTFIVKTAADDLRLMVVDDLRLNRKWYVRLL
jgi:hypothetical protein